MPIYSVQGPDGRIYDVEGPEGASDDQVIAALRQHLSSQPKKEAPRSGVLASAAKGLESLISSGRTAVGAATGDANEAARAALERSREIGERYADDVSFERVRKAYEERGLLPAAGEAISQIPKAIAEQAPNIAATLGSARLGATAGSVFGPYGTLAGGVAGAVAPGFAQMFGSNVERQAAEQQKAGKPINVDVGAAGTTALPQAALDVAGTFIPLGGRLVSKLTGIPAEALLARGAGATARLAEESLLKTLAKGTATGLALEVPTEVAQQMLERAQAGLPLITPDALEEYGQTAYQVSLLAPLGAVGRVADRGQARQEVEAREVEAQRALRAEARAAKAAATQPEVTEPAKRDTTQEEQEAALATYTTEEQLAFAKNYEDRVEQFKQLRAIKKPGPNALPAEMEEYSISRKQLAELQKGLRKDSARYKQAKAVVGQYLERSRVAQMTPEDYMLEQMGQQEAVGRRSTRVPGVRGELTPPPVEETQAPAAISRAAAYANEQLLAARDAGALDLSDQIDYLAANPTRAAELLTERPALEGMSRKESNALYDALRLRVSAEAKAAMQAKADELAGQIPKKEVGKRKAPDYDAYLEALDKLDFDRREGVTESDIRELESLRRQTGVTDQGELFGAPVGQRTVLGNAPKTRQEYVADLRIARAAGDRKAAEAAIANLRKLDDEAESQKKFQTGATPEFRLTGEQRQRLFESGYTEAQIDEAESRAQKSSGQLLGAGQTPMSVAIQQLASDSRAEAFAKIVDLVSRYNRGAAKQEDLNAARDRLVSGLITDIQQSRGKPLTDTERQDITRDANALLRELIERFGDTRNLSQKGELFVPAQTRTGEFATNEVPNAGYPTVESRAPGQQTFGNPLAAAQSIREGLEELRSRAITGDTTSFSREYTPSRVSAEAVQTQLERELAKDPKSHSTEQRRLLEEIGDNLRMMLRPESREDVSAWLYDLARDADNVSPELTRSVKDTLAAVEKSKRSETELETREFVSGTGTRVNTAQQPELPLGPGRELQRTELAGPQRAAPVTEGAYSQISTAPSQEQTQSTVFSNFAELEKYLASDALQQIRSAIGLGRPTLARLNARLEPFVAKIKDIQAKAKELSDQAQQIEQRKRSELESLKALSAKDMAAEERSLTQAKQMLEESKRRLAELEAPLKKELAPLVKEFEAAQKQFEEVVAAQEETFAVMLRSRDVFENREVAAIEKLQRVQRRMQNARSKIYQAFQEDFGKDPKNLARAMREFKETGKQAEFNEQLLQAHTELNKVFFNTRSDDAAIKQFLNNSVKLELQLQAQAGMIDAMALKLLDAGLTLQVVENTQLDLSANKAEILNVRGQAQEATRTLQELEAKQQERLAAVQQLEDSLGLSRQEINHRFSEDVTVAEVLRASNDAEKDLVSRLDALMGLLNENVPAVRAYRAFKRSRDAAIRRQRETPAQKQARDTQQEKLIAAIGRDPASFEGERISFEKRNALMGELKASDEARAELEALIAATDEAIPLMQERIAEAEKELKRLNSEIAALEKLAKKKPRSFKAKLEQKSALVSLPYLIEARDKFAKVPQQMAEDIAAYERDKVTAQSNLETLAEKEAELAGLFSNDPEVQKARTEAIDKRIAKVEDNLRNNIEGLKEKNIKKSTRESREREVRKYKKELQRLQAQRSAKFGITRKNLSTLAPVAAQPAEAGERLTARKVGPLVTPTRTAGNIRTGEISTAGERKISPRAPITQSGKARTETSKQVQTAANAQVAEANAIAEIDSLETLLEEAEANLRSARDTRDATKGDKTAAREAVAKAKKARDAINGRLKEAEARLAEIEAGAVPETAVFGAKEPTKYTPPTYLTVETLPKNIVASVSRLLPEEQIKALEQIYKAERGSDKFARAIKYDVVNYINSGAQSLARDARTPISQIAQAAGLKERARAAYRTGTTGGKGVDYDKLNRMVTEIVKDWKNVPTIATVATFDQLPANIKEQAVADNMQDVLPGLYDPNTNTVYLVAENLHSKEDVIATVAHEVAGHYGLRAMLGGNYAATMNSIYDGNTAVREKADAKMAEMPSLTREVAVEEVLADMSEVAPAQQTVQEKSALRKVYDAIKAWFQRTFGDKVSDAAVQQIVANARRYVIQGGTAAKGVADASGPLYRARAKPVNPSLAKAFSVSNELVAKQKPWTQRLIEENSGLSFATRYIDRFAGFERLAKVMDALKGTQMLYFLRMYDQRMNFVAESVGNGALDLVEKERADGQKEFIVESKTGTSLRTVVETLKQAKPIVGDVDAVNELFTTYLAAKRAERVGFNKLSFGKNITEAQLKAAVQEIESVEGLKDVFEQARAEYNTYNEGLVRFAQKTGALSKEVADTLLASKDYIPYYRQTNDGGVDLIIGGESPIRIGSVKNQPYLHELVGGDEPIFDFFKSSVQNTNLMVDMSLRNLATKNAVMELVGLDAAVISPRPMQGRDIVQFKVNGEDRYARIDTDAYGVDADVLVKGMEGIPVQLTGVMRVASIPTKILRKAVTLSPLYVARQMFRDTLASVVLSGADFTPVLGALKEINTETGKTLERRGITGGQVFTGTQEDLATIMRSIADGKSGWAQKLAWVEAKAMQADSLTRRAQYNSYIKQGLSEMEATLASLESMNFNKRGASPSIHLMNSLIAFTNAQIQGLNVLYRALTGKATAAEKLRIQTKMLTRGALMVVATWAYAAGMEDDEAYKNATPDQKYNNWFIRIPGVDEPLRLPIPFEVGYIFKALPEALYNMAVHGEAGTEDAKDAFLGILRNVIPGGSNYGIPQLLKPAIEVGLGKSFYTGRDLLSFKEQGLMPEAQYRESTSEAAKAAGSLLGVSPIKLEALINGYTGSMGLALLQLGNIGFSTAGSPMSATKRLSDTPVVGTAFQPNDAGNIINRTYELMKDAESTKKTVTDLLNRGERAKAMALLQEHSNAYAISSMADSFQTQMTTLSKYEVAVRASNKSPEEKRQLLDTIRQAKIKMAATYREAAERTTRQQPRP